MTKQFLMTRGALAALATSLMLTTLPAQAQLQDLDRVRPRVAERMPAPMEAQASQAQPQRQAEARAQSQPRIVQAQSWRGNDGQRGRRGGGEARNGGGFQERAIREAAGRAASQQQAQRDGGRTWSRSDGRRDRGSDTGGWQGQRRGNDGRVVTRPGTVPGATTPGTWQRDPSYGANTRGREWQRDGRQDERRAEWRRDQRQDAWRAERRDDARNYRDGYRDATRWNGRNDTRYGTAHRRWDNRGWRSDNRYDWYRYRAANRSIFSPGRYYAPYRGYSYSRVNIGFRLGSSFYSNRYWINDPWRYRLPDAYGPYRWVRYYDDALLVDIYSGQVVDVINNFFW